MMRIIPLTLKQANALVDALHRHHKPARGHRFSIGCEFNGKLVGAAIVGRPVARACDQYCVAEVTRLVTDGTSNACSFLYSAAARIAREMGFDSIQTYILETESGKSVEAAGWQYDGITAGGTWNCVVRTGRREDQPMIRKKRYCKQLQRSASKQLRQNNLTVVA